MTSKLKGLRRSPHGAAQFLRFATVSVVVSSIDVAGLYLLPYLLHTDWHLARAVSLSAATAASFFLNRGFTFGVVHGPLVGQMVGHVGVSLIGAVINYGIFSAVMQLDGGEVQPGVPTTAWPLFALWAGGVASMLFNFVGARRFVFRVASAVHRES